MKFLGGFSVILPTFVRVIVLPLSFCRKSRYDDVKKKITTLKIDNLINSEITR